MEKTKRVRVAGIVIDANSKILLMHRIKNGSEYFAIPGGGAEEGESLQETLIREMKEETNLNVSDFELFSTGEDEENKAYYFLIKKFSGKLEIGGPEKLRQSADNIYGLRWVDIKDIKNINLYPKNIKTVIIKKFYEKENCC